MARAGDGRGGTPWSGAGGRAQARRARSHRHRACEPAPTGLYAHARGPL